jgi:O-antigen ligase
MYLNLFIGIFFGLLGSALIWGELARVVWIQRWIEIMIVLGLIGFIRRPQSIKLNFKLLWLISSFVLTAILASLLGVDLPKSVWGNYWRRDGLVSLLHYFGLVLVLVLNWKQNWKQLLMTSLAGANVWVSLTVLWLWFKLNVLQLAAANWSGIIGAGFVQPVFLAGWLAVTLPALVYKRWYWAIFPATLAILQTRSWGGLLTVGLFFLGWRLIAKKKIKILITAVLLIYILLGAALAVKTKYYIESGRWVLTAEARERIMVKGIWGWIKRPILGWGWANFDYAFKAVDWPEAYLVDVYADKAHSSFLEVLVTSGIIGFGLYIAVIVTVLKKLEGNYLLMFLMWLVHSQTNVFSSAEELLFWLILTVVIAKSKYKL